MTRALITHESDGDRLTVHAHGAWTFDNADQVEKAMERLSSEASQPKSVRLELAEIDGLDTYGAWLIERFSRTWKLKGASLEVAQVPKRFSDLIEAIKETNQVEKVEPRAQHIIAQSVETIGQGMNDFWGDLKSYAAMLGSVSLALGRLALRPGAFRLTSAVHHLDRVGWQAVPIVALITFLIGGIIAQQGIFHFRKFGADIYVVDMIGILVLREIGVLIVAIMVAGRSGSSYTAELGSMKMREEIDALNTMGFDAVDVLILPRILALIVGLTLLAFLGSMSALVGGGMVAWFYGDMNPDIYIARLREAISMTHFKVGMIKAPFMALVIGLVSCTHGFQVKGSAESLGLQTTEAVVKSIFLVIILDGCFAVFFTSIGM